MADSHESSRAGADGLLIANDPSDINNAGFDDQAYVAKLYRHMDLQSLVKREDELQAEIRTLDSDMQTLVYENYNKFISATDTIRQMKSKVQSMESQMAVLAEGMQKTQATSLSIEKTIGGRRSDITRLSQGHATLKKLQFLFELPARLKQCMETNAIEQAVLYYSKVRKLLHRYRDHKSFKGIHTDCHQIAQQLEAKLLGRLAEPELPRNETADTIGLLAKLTGRYAELAKQLLVKAEEQWRDDSKASMAAYHGADDEQSKEAGSEYLHVVEKRMMLNLAEWIICFQDALLGGEEETVLPPADSTSDHDVCARLLIEFVRQCVQDSLMNSSEQLLLQRIKASPVEHDAIPLLNVLFQNVEKMDTLVPGADLITLCCDICVRLTRDALRAATQHIHAECDKELRAIACAEEACTPDDAKHVLVGLRELIVGTLDMLFEATDTSFGVQHVYFKRVFLSRGLQAGIIEGSLTSFNQQIRACFLPHTGKQEDSTTTRRPGFEAVLSALGLAKAAEAHMLAPLFSWLADKLNMDGGDEAMSLAQKDIVHLVSMTQNDLVQHIGMLAAAHVTDDVTQLVVLTCENDTPPTKPSAIADTLCNHMDLLQASLQLYLPPGDVSLDTPSDFMSKVQTNVMSNVLGLFSDAIQVFAPCHASAASVSACVMRALFKAGAETARTCVFSKQQAQQLQVDITAIYRRCAMLIASEEDDSAISSLAAQMLSNVLQRCTETEGVLLDEHAMRTLCDPAHDDTCAEAAES